MSRLKNLWKGIVGNKKAVACMLILALVLPKTSALIVNAEDFSMDFSVSGSQISGGDSTITGGDANPPAGGNVPGQEPEENSPGGDVQEPEDGGQVSGGDVQEPENGGQVSGGDAQEPENGGQVSGGDAQEPENGGQVSEGDMQEPDEELQVPEEEIQKPEEHPDRESAIPKIPVQQLEMICENTYTVGELQIGNASSEFIIRPVPLTDSEKEAVKPLVGFYYGYDGQEYYAEYTEEGVTIQIPYEYFGNLYCYGVDEAGNTSDRLAVQIMIDCNAPVITWEEIELNESRYMRIVLEDAGNVLSGIDLTNSFLYGVPQEYISIQEEIVENSFGQAVLGRVVIDISLEKLEDVNVELSVSDCTGNLATGVVEWSAETMADESEILSVMIPCDIPFVISTWKPDKQIQSEQLTVENNSKCDIYFKFSNVNVIINRDNVLENPELKDCEIYLGTQEGVRYRLPEGDSGVLNIVRIPGQNVDVNGDNTFTFFIEGYIHPDSDEYWRDGDISISISVSFWGIEPEEEETEITEPDAAILKEESEE